MRRIRLLVFGSMAVLLLPATARPLDPAAENLLARALSPSPIVSDLEELTDDIGGRVTGTPAAARAEAWAHEKLRDAGLANARLEPYRIPRAWIPGSEAAEVDVRGERRLLRVAAMPYTPATPADGITAEVIDVGRGEDAGFAGAGERLAGRWALVRTEPMKGLGDLFAEYMATPAAFELARRAHAAGILWMADRPGRVLYRHPARIDVNLTDLPGFVVEREGALRIERQLARKLPVRVRAMSLSRTETDVAADNVVAEIRGATHPEEVVVVGAHLDSWELGAGAQDNGCNAALVIDAARQIAVTAREHPPARTIRFLLYTGEEDGVLGSLADVRRHRGELDRVKAQITIDIGSGRITGFSLGGRSDTRAAIDDALGPVAALGPFTQTSDAFIGTDNYDYMMEGVPTFVANQDDRPYLPDYHADTDTFDKVDGRELKANEAIISMLVWNLAQAPQAPGPRLSRAEIERMARDTGLDQQMKALGFWDDFAAGRRGRQP